MEINAGSEMKTCPSLSGDDSSLNTTGAPVGDSAEDGSRRCDDGYAFRYSTVMTETGHSSLAFNAVSSASTGTGSA